MSACVVLICQLGLKHDSHKNSSHFPAAESVAIYCPYALLKSKRKFLLGLVSASSSSRVARVSEAEESKIVSSNVSVSTFDFRLQPVLLPANQNRTITAWYYCYWWTMLLTGIFFSYFFCLALQLPIQAGTSLRQ